MDGSCKIVLKKGLGSGEEAVKKKSKVARFTVPRGSSSRRDEERTGRGDRETGTDG